MRLRSLADYLERRPRKTGFSGWNSSRVVWFGDAVAGAAQQSLDHLSQGSVLLSLCDGLMHGIIPVRIQCLWDPEQSSSERRACVSQSRS